MNNGITTSQVNITYDYYNCPHKLPCGYCSLLYRDCPRQSNTTINPYWREQVTCNTGGNNNGK